MHLSLRHYILTSLAILALLILLAVADRLGGKDYLWFRMQQTLHSAERQGKSIWLPDYEVVVEAQPIEGVNNDLSALTYDPDRNTLFSVTNTVPQVVEMSLEGRLIRSIPLTGFSDPEAIEYLAKGIYLISDERTQRLVKIRLDDNTTVLDAADFQQLSLSIDLNGNKGFEGLAYDSGTKRTFVAKEQSPVRLYEIHGFPYMDRDLPLALDVRENPAHNDALFVRDISSLQFDERTGHLLVLSDESHLLLELATDGQPLSSLSLLSGQHGLKNSIMQAEGVAMDNTGTLYLISEPNLLYIFRKPAR